MNAMDEFTAKSIVVKLVGGLTPMGCNPKVQNWLSAVLFYFMTANQIILALMMIANLQNPSLDNLAKTVMFLPVLLETMLKNCPIYFKRRRFERFLSNMDFLWANDKFVEKSEEYRSKFVLMHQCAKAYKISIVVALVVHIFMPFYSKELVFECWTPFDKELFKTDLLVLTLFILWQSTALVIPIYSGVIILDSLVLMLAEIAIMQFQMLQCGLMGMEKKRIKDDERFSLIKQYAKHYSKMLEFVKEIEYLLSFALLGLLLRSVYGICFAVFFMISKGVDFKLITYTYNSFCALAVYCIFGQRIMNESKLVGDAAYFSGWENSYNKNIRIGVQMLIMRSNNRVAKISAGYFYVLSVELLANGMKAMASLNALLLQLGN